MSSRAGTHHWYGRVAACEQGYSPVVDGGAVTRLRSTGSILYAMESHGLVTTLQALAAAPDSWVALLPVGRQGPDDWRGALMAVDMLPAAQSGGEVAGPHTGSHRALLVATHPASLLLLQRYLAVERNNLAAELREAEAAWEAGARPEYGGGGGGVHVHLRLLQRPPVPVVVQPWQGAGEVAPWQQQQQQGQQARQQQQQQPGRPAGRAGLAAAAAAAAAAGGASGSNAAEVQGVLGLLDPLPSDAQPMMPSVVAAPAPSTTLLCAARLGLHPQPLDGSDGNGSRTPPDDASASAAHAAAAQTVLCLSASGGVSAAALLPPNEAVALLNEQSRLVWQLEGGAPEQPLLQVEKAAPSNSTVLRLLYRAGGLAARAQGHALAPGAVTPRAAAARWHNAPKPANEEDALDEEGSALAGCVDADLLLSAAGTTLTDDDGDDALHAQVLHQMLWQAVL
jgi:hypothetical protein